MSFPPSYILFFFTLMAGSFLSISSSSWMAAWIGLELNLLSFIPLIASSSSAYFSESALKYFLIQAVASTMIIMASSIQLFSTPFYSFILLLSLIMKLGAAPFHFWFPQIMEGLTWGQAAILLSIQKLAPMYLISFLSFNPQLTFILLLSSGLSSLMGALGGFNSLKLRKILAYSSINHMSWMLLAISINEMLFFLYFMFYVLISFSSVFLFSLNQAHYFNDLFNFNSFKPIYFYLIPFSLFSLGGLPPFLGFIPKWILVQTLIVNNMFIMLSILLFSTLITLFFYIRLSIPFILMLLPSSSLTFKPLLPNMTNYMIFIIIFLNFLSFFLPFPFLLL